VDRERHLLLADPTYDIERVILLKDLLELLAGEGPKGTGGISGLSGHRAMVGLYCSDKYYLEDGAIFQKVFEGKR
jgi:hypothetical protein